MVSNLQNEEFTIDAIQSAVERTTNANGELIYTPQRTYIPITHFKDGISSFFSTYDENLTIKNNSQYSLTFSINKYVDNQTNQVFYLITEGRRLRLQIATENPYKPKAIDFIITAITPKVTNKNNVLSVTCQDVFSYETSKMNISITYNSVEPKTYYEHLKNILILSGLDKRYKIHDSLNPEGQNPIFTNPFTLALTNTYNALKTTVNIENSTFYNALVQLATDFNALLDIEYPEYVLDEVNNTWVLTSTSINFINIRNSVFEGYIVRPETNLNSFSVTRKADNFNSILHVKGGEDSDGATISIIPSMPSTVQEFFEKQLININDINNSDSFWKKSSKDWYALYQEEYGRTMEFSNSDSQTQRMLKDEVNYYWRALTELIPSGGDFLYSFDHYKEQGLLSQADYNYLKDKINIDLRNANIKQNIFSSQYYRLQSELDVIHTAELDYASFISSDMEYFYNLEKEHADDKNEQQINLEKNLNDNTINYLNDLINLWADKDFRYIQNYKMFYNISEHPSEANIDLQGIINDDTFKLSSNSDLNTEFNTNNNYLKLNFNYVTDKAQEIGLLYNQACHNYNTLYNKLIELFSPYKRSDDSYIIGSYEPFSDIASLLSTPDDQLEDIIYTQTGSKTLYIDYAYYREQMKDLRTKIGSYYKKDGKMYYRLGIYFTYLELLFCLDKMRIVDNKILVQEDWLNSLPLKLILPTNKGIDSPYALLKEVTYTPTPDYAVDFKYDQKFTVPSTKYSNGFYGHTLSLQGEVWNNALSLGKISKCINDFGIVRALTEDNTVLFYCNFYSDNSECYISSFSDFTGNTKHIQINNFIFTYEGIGTTIWSKHPVTYNLKQLKTESENSKLAIWNDLYNYYGDYITEGVFTDSDQLTSEGLYIAAAKQFAAYCKPTIEYSTTVINQNEILGFNSKLGLGDIIHFYNKELLEGYNGHIIVEIPKQSFLISSVELRYNLQDNSSISTVYPISKTQQKTNTTLLYIKEDSLDTANKILSTPFTLHILEEIQVINKYLDTIAKPIELQVTGLSTKLRSGTTQITVSNNKTINAMLGRLLRQFK